MVDGFNLLEKKTQLLQRLKQLRTLSKFPELFKQNLVIHFTMVNGLPSYEINGFNSLQIAGIHYFILEKRFPNDDIVLVKSSDKKSILEAYRNYFADAKDFTGYIEEGIKKLSTPLPK